MFVCRPENPILTEAIAEVNIMDIQVCTDKKAYLGVVKAWLGSSWRIGQLGKQQNRCFMV